MSRRSPELGRLGRPLVSEEAPPDVVAGARRVAHDDGGPSRLEYDADWNDCVLSKLHSQTPEVSRSRRIVRAGDRRLDDEPCRRIASVPPDRLILTASTVSRQAHRRQCEMSSEPGALVREHDGRYD